MQVVCDRAHGILRQFPPSGGQPYGPGETIALTSIKALIKRRGHDAAERVLNALFKAECAPITSELIKAGEALLCDVDYATEFDVERLATTIRGLPGGAQDETKSLAAAKRMPMWRALVATLCRYRRGKAPAKTTSDAPVAQAGVAAPSRRPAVPPPEPAPYASGDPPPGRSALDQRRSQA